MHVLLLHVVLFSLACGTGKFAVEEKHGRLLYTSPDKQLQLTFYGDYVFYKSSAKVIESKAPELKRIAELKKPVQSHSFLFTTTYLSPWIQCLGTYYPINDATLIDSSYILSFLPSDIINAHIKTFHSDINGNPAVQITYSTDGHTFADYFSQIGDKLVRLTFSSPDSSAENMVNEAGTIFGTMIWHDK